MDGRAAAILVLGGTAFGQTQVLTLNGAAAGDGFGASIAFVDDTDGDGFSEFAIGSPLSDVAGADAGRVDLYSGRTSQRIRTWNGAAGTRYFGSAIAPVGDLDGDSIPDVAIGAAGWGGSYPSSWIATVDGYVHLVSGATGGLIAQLDAPAGIRRFGYALAGGRDLDGDGVGEILVGAPGDDNDAGYVYVYDGATFAFSRRDGAPSGFNFGFSIAFLGDVSGDGVDDYASGAPRYEEGHDTPPWVHAVDGASGAALWSTTHPNVWSQFGWSLARVDDVDGDGADDLLVGSRGRGGSWLGCMSFSEIGVLSSATGNTLRTHQELHNCSAYGTSAAYAGDLDGDGSGEYLAGGPGWWLGADSTERLRIFGGTSGALVAEVYSPNGQPLSLDAFGFSIAAGDANGDGLSDLLVGAPFDDAGGANAGAVFVYTIVRGVATYCEAETNSLGCTPYVAGVGVPSATLVQAFRIKAFDVLNNRSGLLFYGFAPRAAPFLGGTMCVQAPTRRTPIQDSGGNAGVDDCSGAFSFDFNVHIRSGVDPMLVAGEEVFAQHWSRDPNDPSTTNLTDAIAFAIEP